MAGTLKTKRKSAPFWLVTFADLMALLFALFVLFMSFSEVDTENFKKNAGPMAEAFNQVYDPNSTPNIIKKPPKPKLNIPKPPEPNQEISAGNDTYLREVARNKIVNLVQSTISSELASDKLKLVVEEDRVTMRFPAGTAFRAGDDTLSTNIIPTMDKVATILTRTKGIISVTGHSDSSPISTARFSSNWALSAARAVSVVHRILRNAGLDPARVTATGRADTQPLFNNDSAANRAKNRRVEISVEIPQVITSR